MSRRRSPSSSSQSSNPSWGEEVDSGPGAHQPLSIIERAADGFAAPAPLADDNDNDDDDIMADFSYSSPGSLPGTLNIPKDALPTELFLIEYGPEAVRKATVDHPEECRALGSSSSVTWLDARGLGTEETLIEMARTFDLHPLLLEDIVNVPHRPKIDFYDDKILIIMQMVRPKATGSGVSSEQVSFVVGSGFVITFQEEPEWDSFGPVRDRIRRGTGTIRRQNAAYLAYALLDTIVDSFFPVLEVIGETLEELEEEVVENPTNATIKKIHRMRRGLMKLRRYIWPQRSVINSLIRDSDELISQEVRVYLQDVYDHIVQVVDIIENYREIASSLMDVYLSSINNRMNEVMKLLTVISSIFIPLTFIAGIYGMNFNSEKSPFNMPELQWYWGYAICLGVMAAIALLQVFFFWKRGWFDNFSTTRR
ncbi:MAG: magnesium/cobalt transporter CorA [Nodosilinea sp.]